MIKILIAQAILYAIILVCVARGEAPDQVARWNAAKLEPRDYIRLESALAKYRRNQATYEKISAMEKNGVPAPVVFAFHYRESDNDFSAHLHEGSSLRFRTRYEPKGRIPGIEPPYSFLVSARDALYDYEGLQKRDWRNLGPAMQAIESYNGLGYQKRGVLSPYMWSGTSLYRGGKYVSDGRYSPTARDAQLGVIALLLHFKNRGITTPFEP